MASVIGEFFEQPDEIRGEWRAKKFLSLPKQVDKPFFSPNIFFAGSCWNLVIFPNGMSKNSLEGSIGLYLQRTDFGPPVTVSCTLGLRKADGTEQTIFRKNGHTFLRQRGDSSFLVGVFINRTCLEDHKAEFLPSEVLTVACTLKNDRLLSTEDSLFTRLWNMSLRFRSILKGSKRTDFVLKLKEGKTRVHRLILEESSPVFHRMLNTDMREAQTGEMDVGDLDQGAFIVVLAYMYCGDPISLSTENVREVFKIAHLYELQQLTRLCTKLMLEELSVNSVCEAIELATLYQEAEMLETAKDCFMRNADEVVKTDAWKKLKSEHPAIVSDLLESIIEKKLLKTAI